MRLRVILICVALLLPACTAVSPASEQADASGPGTVAPATPESYRETLASFRGRPVVVNFWATWCGPCAEEKPRFVEAERIYSSRVQFLGVAVEDVQDESERFLRRYGVGYPNIGDSRGEIRRAERVLGLPTTLFYRSDGQLAFAHAGEISSEQLHKKLDELVRIDKTAVRDDTSDDDDD